MNNTLWFGFILLLTACTNKIPEPKTATLLVQNGYGQNINITFNDCSDAEFHCLYKEGKTIRFPKDCLKLDDNFSSEIKLAKKSEYKGGTFMPGIRHQFLSADGAYYSIVYVQEYERGVLDVFSFHDDFKVNTYPAGSPSYLVFSQYKEKYSCSGLLEP